MATGLKIGLVTETGPYPRDQKWSQSRSKNWSRDILWLVLDQGLGQEPGQGHAIQHEVCSEAQRLDEAIVNNNVA